MNPELQTKLCLLTTPGSGQCLEGWLTPERAVEMADLVIKVNPEVCVEIGTFGGRSLIAQALALRENGKGVIYGIDSWKFADTVEGESDAANVNWWSKNVDLHQIHRGCMEAVWREQLDKWAIVIRAQSQHAAQLFSPKSIDILFIDGCHSEISSCRDVELYLPRVKHNGYIWMDDTSWASTQKAVRMMTESCTLVSEKQNYRLYVNRSPSDYER